MNDINHLITMARLTTAQVATLCNVDPRTVRRWRAGPKSPATARLLLSLIVTNGIHIITVDPAGIHLITSMVESMAAQGYGTSTIQRQIKCGYGIIGRILDDLKQRPPKKSKKGSNHAQ